MVKLNQSSFRRILLSRILILSVPVLLIGEMVTFRQVRSSLLEISRQHLNVTAREQSKQIQAQIAAMQTKMVLASQTTALKSGSPLAIKQFLERLKLQSSNIKCLQLTSLPDDKLIAGNCDRRYPIIDSSAWSMQQVDSLLEAQNIQIQSVFLTASSANKQMQLLLSAPVYDRVGRLRYVLKMQSVLSAQDSDRQFHLGAMAADAIAITESGTIIAHPTAERIGGNISQEPNPQVWEQIIDKAISPQDDELNNVSFVHNGEALLASYEAIDSPISTEQGQHWIILAITPQSSALQGLREIKLILVLLTISLLGASLLTALHLARKLAEPLEQLRDYALKLQNHHEIKRIPHNFKIREFNQLAFALDRMVERLKMSAEELEIAWTEAKAANESKSNFLATTSHELRNPLNAIINCIRLVRDDYCDNLQEEAEFLERAEDAAIHLLGIINDLLDIAKIEAGKMSLVMEELDLEQVLQEVISLQAIHIKQKNLQLIAAKRPEQIIVKSDRAKLKQVLINVFANAVKFTEIGTITVQTQIESEANHNWRVTIIVEDTGIGIEPSQQHKLFRPFGMADGTTTRKFGGTGLGLAISRNLIELMGGSIMLCSAGIDRGTKVAISLPLVSIVSCQLPVSKTPLVATPPAGSVL